MSIERAVGEGWSAHDILIRFEPPRQHAFATIRRLQLTDLSQDLRNIRIECPHLELSALEIACTRARVVADWPAAGAQSLTARIVYGRRTKALDIEAGGVRLGSGSATVAVSLREGGWRGTATLQRVPVEALTKLAGELGLPMPSLSASGLVNASASARGVGGQLLDSAFDAAFVELTANSESGSLASDKLEATLQGKVRKNAEDWQFSIELHSAQGQAYVQPIFLDLGAHAAKASLEGRLRGASELMLERFALEHAGVAHATGSALIAFAQEQPVRSLNLQLASLEFPGAYETYLQPLLLETSFKEMQTAGKAAGTLTVANGSPQQMGLSFQGITFDDGAGGFALEGLHGSWNWHAEPAAQADVNDLSATANAGPPSSLRWQGGSVFGVDLGPTELQFATRGREFRLLQPARIPLLDGAVGFDSFRVRNAGLPSVAFMVDATLQPIDVQRLCKAFGWPEFGGRLGGSISKLRMRDGVMTLGTTLRARVFDGEVTISDLRLQQPFGQWPLLHANIALDNLDLQLITGAFSFGRMTGRLSGEIDGLRLFNWAPVAFDARLYTPPGDRSRHRISQRAVENIGSLGGGSASVTAALSSGLLRFFDDFNYDRLGLSCRLENDICIMDGIEPAPTGGYYLVKGKGLPRIDVIGSSRRVDWPRLVQQLAAATQSGGPTVQ